MYTNKPKEITNIIETKAIANKPTKNIKWKRKQPKRRRKREKIKNGKYVKIRQQVEN